MVERERFLRYYTPAAERFLGTTARRSAANSRKNAYDFLFAILRRLQVRVPWYSQTFFGQRMHILLPEFGSCTVIENGILDTQTPLYFAAVLREGGVCFDGGANFGFYSLLARSLVGRSGSVHSFEPADFAFSYLRKNLGKTTNVCLINAAVSNSDGNISFAKFGTIAGGFNRVAVPEKAAPKAELIEVRCLRLDTYCAEVGVVPDLIKLDVEGHELAALKGAVSTVEKGRPYVILEYGMADDDNIGASTFLLSRGYRSLVAKDGGLRFCSVEEIAASPPGENILFATPDRLAALSEWLV
jgi:FkbM family methyltransferase